MSLLRESPAPVRLDGLRGDGDDLYWLADGRLQRGRPGGEPIDVTPPSVRIGGHAHTHGGGDFVVTPDAIWCAGSDGLHRDAALVAKGAFGDLVLGDGELLAVREDATGDALVAVPLDGGEVRVLAEAAGFFGSPRPAAGMVAWTWWSARDMPWDGCEVWVAAYEPGGEIGDPMRVAGGPDESAIEPRWGPDGMLYFMSNRTGFWNLYRHDGTALAPLPSDCAAVPRGLGNASFCFLGDGRIAMIAREDAGDRLLLVDGSDFGSVALPYTTIEPCLTGLGSSVALIGSSPTLEPQVAVVDLAGDAPRLSIVAGGAARAGVAPTRLRVRGLAPALIHPAGRPLIVHAAPSSPVAGFFAAHGFTVVEVDPHDSFSDCRAVASYLIAEGRAAPGQVFIRGTGIGGYAALRAVSEDGPFAAAVAVSTVIDPARWAARASRFERPSATRLAAGALPVTAPAIRTPVLLIHGTDDPATPTDDVVHLADALRSRDAPHELLLLAGADITDSEEALEAELRLYQRLLVVRD